MSRLSKAHFQHFCNTMHFNNNNNNNKWSESQRILTKGHISCRAVIEHWMIHLAAYTAAEVANAFQWVEHPQKFPFPWRISTPSNTQFLGPTAPQTASRSVQPLLHSTPVWPTHRRTYSDICSNGRIYALRAGDAA